MGLTAGERGRPQPSHQVACVGGVGSRLDQALKRHRHRCRSAQATPHGGNIHSGVASDWRERARWGRTPRYTLGRLPPGHIRKVPAEPLNALGQRLNNLARPKEGPSHVWCAGYANGCYGYLALPEEYARGGYEIGGAHRYYGRPGPIAPDT